MAVLIEVKVVPNAGKQNVALDKNGTLRCHVKSAAEKGRANKELIKMLSKKLHVTQEDIDIIRGATSRNKTLRIQTFTNKNEVFKKLGIELQLTI
jgi:uncharacterized protein (TIGR00251 family)